VVARLHILFDYAWFVGALVAGSVYWLFSARTRPS